jgi:hypothetical protein
MSLTVCCRLLLYYLEFTLQISCHNDSKDGFVLLSDKNTFRRDAGTRFCDIRHANCNYSKEKSFKRISWATKLLHQSWQQETAVSHPTTS